jgi:hypothetical protein
MRPLKDVLERDIAEISKLRVFLVMDNPDDVELVMEMEQHIGVLQRKESETEPNSMKSFIPSPKLSKKTRKLYQKFREVSYNNTI